MENLVYKWWILMGSSASHIGCRSAADLRSQDRIIKELQQQHGFSSLQVRAGSAEAKKQATFFSYIFDGKTGFQP